MAVTSKPLGSGDSPKSGRPRIGFLRPSHIERAFIAFIYLAVLVLVLLSVIGTFYGLHGESAPLAEPARIWTDIQAGGNWIWIACGAQAAFSLTQYGARQMAAHDRRWWLVYLAALAFSVYYNILAYWTPLTDFGLAWYIALAVILAGDVIPEIAAVRHS